LCPLPATMRLSRGSSTVACKNHVRIVPFLVVHRDILQAPREGTLTIRARPMDNRPSVLHSGWSGVDLRLGRSPDDATLGVRRRHVDRGAGTEQAAGGLRCRSLRRRWLWFVVANILNPMGYQADLGIGEDGEPPTESRCAAGSGCGPMSVVPLARSERMRRSTHSSGPFAKRPWAAPRTEEAR
jgi:hypothetical protein